ncbi:conserved exported hypothetical protein [Flavobacterium sp. 9AF]|uniref:hypothetical protein n=1 Tax=Flavobacterium sp. 9AF TaxID=2653142 RepID=UPI0012F26AC2|nr:hypothetical protein [Flavobacterium sp. 9AF]VXB05201.1 conserved exported hypothetical protein [Flavobacterium sp. 9AF]
MSKLKPPLNKILFLLLFSISFVNQAQNIFDEKFEGCNTDRFATEKDAIEVRETNKDLIYVLANNLETENVKKIKGLLSFQIIVDLNGKSCLLSVDNDTNIPTKKLNLKEIIDQNLNWEKPTEKTSVIIAIMFNGASVEKKRIGMSSEKGFHQIK